MTEFDALAALISDAIAPQPSITPHDLAERVRVSSLTSQEIGKLLDRVPHVRTGHAVAKCEALRLALGRIREDRMRAEEHRTHASHVQNIRLWAERNPVLAIAMIVVAVTVSLTTVAANFIAIKDGIQRFALGDTAADAPVEKRESALEPVVESRAEPPGKTTDSLVHAMRGPADGPSDRGERSTGDDLPRSVTDNEAAMFDGESKQGLSTHSIVDTPKSVDVAPLNASAPVTDAELGSHAAHVPLDIGDSAIVALQGGAVLTSVVYQDARSSELVFGSPLRAGTRVFIDDVARQRCRIQWRDASKTRVGWVDRSDLRRIAEDR